MVPTCLRSRSVSPFSAVSINMGVSITACALLVREWSRQNRACPTGPGSTGVGYHPVKAGCPSPKAQEAPLKHCRGGQLFFAWTHGSRDHVDRHP